MKWNEAKVIDIKANVGMKVDHKMKFDKREIDWSILSRFHLMTLSMTKLPRYT